MNNIFVDIADLDITEKLYEIILYSNSHAQNYTFYLSEFDEQSALDKMIDYCENNIPGLIMSRDEERSNSYLEDFIYGGNHCRYMTILWDCMVLEKVYDAKG